MNKKDVRIAVIVSPVEMYHGKDNRMSVLADTPSQNASPVGRVVDCSGRRIVGTSFAVMLPQAGLTAALLKTAVIWFQFPVEPFDGVSGNDVVMTGPVCLFLWSAFSVRHVYQFPATIPAILLYYTMRDRGYILPNDIDQISPPLLNLFPILQAGSAQV